MIARLRIVGGPCSGKSVYVPQGKLLIGRADDCDLRLLSEFVSSHHCVLLHATDALRIRDLGSKNGTYVNGRRIGTQMVLLLPDDAISIAELNLLVELSQAAETEPAAGWHEKRESSQKELEKTGSFDETTQQLDGAIPPPPASAPLTTRSLSTNDPLKVMPPTPDSNGSTPSEDKP